MLKHIQIELTNRCQFQCKFCEVKNHKTNTDMSLDMVKNIIDEIGERNSLYGGVSAVSFNGLGEPLLYADLPEAVQYAKNAGFTVGFVTNGYALTEQLARRLLEIGLDYICFSINAVREDVYKDFQGYGLKNPADVMHKVIENIKMFLVLRKSMGKKTLVRISFIKTEQSKGHLNEFIRYWKATGEEIMIMVIKLWTFSPVKGKFARCDQLGEIAMISSDGDVAFCCCNHFRKESLGNVKNAPLSEILAGETFKSIVEANEKGDFDNMPAACKYCEKLRYEGFLQNYSVGYQYVYLNNRLKCIKWKAYSLGMQVVAELRKHNTTWPLYRKIRGVMYAREYSKLNQSRS